MKIKFLSTLTISLFSIFSMAQLHPTKLTCEYLKNPPVVDVQNPRLAWINIATPGERGQKQTAWQLKVASSEDKLTNPDLWDSKKIISEESTRIEYDGITLPSRQECWWQVRIWDRDNDVSEWSKPATWRMGLLDKTDWIAEWIGPPWQGEEALPKPKGGSKALPEKLPPPAPLLRKNFTITKKISKAVVFVTGLGYFELYVNGKKVSDDVLVPNQTNYGKRPYLINEGIPLEDNFKEYKVMYLAYDIKDQLQNGENTLGSILGNGFYNCPKNWTGSYGSPRFLCQAHITYTDGTEDIIVSDKTWKASKSAILTDLVYYGEHYDARKEQTGWSTPEFDDLHWEKVINKKSPEGKLVAHTSNTDKVTERLAPVTITKTAEGNYKVDFGIEISGWLRFNNVTGTSGHKTEIKYLSNQYSGNNSYIFKGGMPESYSARFNWFVFSSVEIINWPGELKAEQITAEAVNTNIEKSAIFKTSNALFNDINKIWRRSQTDNMHGGIASDCPHRERSGYTGDGQVACVTVMHNFDAQNFYHKWIQDMLGAQNAETGYVPNGAPWQPGCGGGVAWGAAICIMPWEFYLHYGSIDMLSDNYEGMKGYIRYMRKWIDTEGIMYSQALGNDGKPLKWMNLGEWCTPGKQVPDEMVHTFYLWRCADFTSKTANVLGKTKESKEYSELAEKTKLAFQKRFYDEKNGTYGNNGGNIFALKMGVPDNQYKKVIASLKANIRANNGNLDTGIFGTQFFFEILSENGLHQEAYEALNKRTEPSFGHWLELGATTTREQWDETGSHNHPMFGGGLVWFYRKLAGMDTDQNQPGYKHIIFRPQPVNEVESATYSNNTPYGKAGITWKNKNDSFLLGITVPVGSEATVYIPSNNPKKITENGKKIKSGDEIIFQKMENGYAIFKVGSGNYNFENKRLKN